MNPNALRGLAALCLLCVLPKLGATVLTMTQTANVSNGNSGQRLVGAGATFHFAPFDSALGVLESVTFAATASVTVSAGDVHWYPAENNPPVWIAREFTPYTAMHLDFIPGTNIPQTRVSDYSYGERTLVQPFQSFSHTHLHVTTFSQTESAVLASYLDPSLTFLRVNTIGEGYARYGGLSVYGSVQASLTYNYRVPEAGATIAMLGGALLLLFVVGCRAHGIMRVSMVS
jgi:drug/metabolite transporter superfamily protein YnfA